MIYRRNYTATEREREEENLSSRVLVLLDMQIGSVNRECRRCGEIKRGSRMNHCTKTGTKGVVDSSAVVLTILSLRHWRLTNSTSLTPVSPKRTRLAVVKATRL